MRGGLLLEHCSGPGGTRSSVRLWLSGADPFASKARSYEHQNPLASVAALIGLHLPGPGFPVVPQARQIHVLPWLSRKISRHGPAENCVQQPSNVQLAAGAAWVTARSLPVRCATVGAKKNVKRTNATANN